MARLHSFWRGPRLGVVWGCGSLALSTPGTWARLRPGRGIFHLGGGMGRVHKTVLYISVSFAVSYTGLLLPSS